MHMQQTLFSDATLPLLTADDDAPIAPKVFADSAFEDNKSTAMHRWVPWIAGFSADFVRDAFSHYLPDRPPQELTILEPFSGVGTTLVEGLLAGHNVIGFEINPFAYLSSKVKCNAHSFSLEAVDSALCDVALKASKRIRAVDDAVLEGKDPKLSTAPPRSVSPPNFRSRVPFLSPLVELKVLHCLDAISDVDDERIRELFMLAFGSILVSVSNYSYEPSLGSRVAAGRLPVIDDDVLGKLTNKIRNMRQDICGFKSAISKYAPPPTAEVYNESSSKISKVLEPRSVDLVVTSPPYLNNYHYIRNTRPHLFWLDFVTSASQLKSIEHASFGKFWQTVREADLMGLSFEMPELERVVGEIASRNNHKGVYGGKGWANYAVQYFNDCYLICEQLRYVLQPGAYAVFVLGNSVIQGVQVKTDEIFGRIGRLAGLELNDIHLLRSKRVGNSVIQSAMRNGVAIGAKLYETAVVLRQPER